MITIILIEDSKVGGYTGYIKEFPNIPVEGETLEEVKQNLSDVLHDLIMDAKVDSFKL